MVQTTSIGSRIADVIIYIILGLVMFICFIPMWHVLMASFSDGKMLLAHEGLLWWPVGTPTLERYNLTFAVIIIATVPILCAFPFFQKQLEKGTITGGVKE